MKQRFTQLIAKAISARLGKVYLTSWLLLLFLMMGNVAWGQTQVYSNDFSSSDGITTNFSRVETGNSPGVPGVVNGELRADGLNGNPRGYSGYFIINTGLTVFSGVEYQLSVDARTVNSGSILRITRGTSAAEVQTPTAANTILNTTISSTGYTTRSSSAFAGTQPLYIGIFVQNIASANNAQIFLDNLVITQTCVNFPAAPTNPVSAARCGPGEVTLSVAGAPNGGSYRWYTTQTGGSAIDGATAASFTTPSLNTTTTYYVSAVSPAGCESTTRTAVTATVGPAIANNTLTQPTQGICAGTAAPTIQGAAATGGMGTITYTWQSSTTSSTTGFTNIASSNTQNYSPGALNQTTWFRRVATTPGSGCTNTSTAVQVTVNPLPATPTNVAANPTSLCGPGTVALSATTGTNGTTVRWYTESTGGTAVATGTSISRTVSATTIFYAASYNANTQCESTRVPVTVTVNPVPGTPTVQAPAPICGPGSVMLSATLGANSTTARWYDAPSGGTPLATATSFSPSVTGTTTFYVSGYSASTTCESSRVPVQVRVNPVPAAPTVTGDVICDGGEVTLSAIVGSNGNQVRWYTAASDDTPFTTGASYTTTVSQTTTYYVSSYNTDTACESARVPVTATVIETPVATVIPEGPLAICSGTTTVLAANPAPAGIVYTYQWSDENGVLTEETDQTLTVSEAGTYSVVITSEGLCVSEPSNAVTVTLLPLPDAPIAEPVSRCGPGTVTLTASGAPEGGTYRWYTTAAGGSPIATGATYNTPDLELSRLYYVAAVGAGDGCESLRTQVEVTIKPLPVASITAETPRCQDPSGTTTFLLNGFAENGTFLSWEIVGGTATAVIIENAENDFTPQVNVTGSGTVQVQLTVNSNNDCGADTDVIELEVYPLPPAVAVNVAPVDRCGPGEVTLNISNASATFTYNWYNAANELVFTGTSYTTSINQTTSFFIAVTGTGDCESPQRTEVIATVNPIPDVPTSVTASATSVCGSETVTLSATAGTNGNTVRWYTAATGGTPVATGTSYSPTVSATTTFYASSYNTVTQCESGRVPVTVTVNAVPGVPTVSAPAPLCGGGSVSLTAVLGANSTTARWYSAATDGVLLATGTSYNPTVTSTTTYFVSGYNANTGCESGSRVAVTVTVNPVPAAATNVTASPAALCGSGTSTLSATPGANGTTIRWYSAATGGTLLNTGTSVSRSVSATTTFYAASYNATTGCESGSRVAVTVTVNPVPAVATNVTASPSALCGSGTSTLSATPGANGTTIRWYSAATGGTLLNTGTSVSRSVSATTTFYAASYNATTGCESGSRVAVTVTVNPLTTVSFTGLTAGQILYTGENSVPLAGSPVGGTFTSSTGRGITLSNGVYSFSPCAAGAGQHTITYSFTNSSGCTSSVSRTVTVRESQYRVVVMSTPKPFCQGDNVSHEAYVIRDGDFTYPYLTNANGDPVDVNGNLIGPGQLPVSNPAYPFPANTPEIIKQNAYRYFNPIINSGVRVNDANSPIAFTYQWTKNQDNLIGPGRVIFDNAGLSSLDYYAVYVTSSGTCPGLNRVLSSRTYTSQLNGYEITLNASKNPICPGEEVTFTAALGAFPSWSTINLVLQWQVNGNTQATTSYSGNADALTWTTAGPNGGFVQGDVVTIVFTSDVDSQDQAGSKCAGGTNSSAITMNLNTVPSISSISQDAAFCAGSTASLSVNATGTGLSYQWYKRPGNSSDGNGTILPGATGSTLNINNVTASDAGFYYVVVTGTCDVVQSGNIQLNVTPLPTVYTITSSDTEYCAGSGVTMGLSGSEPNTAYNLLRNGIQVATFTRPAGQSGPFNFIGSFTAGTYTVSAITVASQPGRAACPTDMSGSITVTENPLPTVTVNSPTVCVGTPAIVTAIPASGTGPYNYTWVVPAGATNPGNVASFNTNVEGTYRVIVSDSKSCASSEAVSTVTINEFVSPTAEELLVVNDNGPITATNPIIPGESITIIANSQVSDLGLSAEYIWEIGNEDTNEWGEPISTVDNFLTIRDVQPGEFDVRVTINPISNGEFCFNPIIVVTAQPLVPLPVEIIYFTAAKQGNNVLLEWATASEENNTGFEVLVSQDGFNFRKLDFVPTKNGNTVIKQVYQYTDKENGKRGTRYYRLKQIDEDGRFEYFTTKAVTFSEVASKVKAFPNPFTTKITLDIAAENSGQVQVTMWNAVGRQLMEQTVEVEEGFNTVSLDVRSDLTHGIYFLRVYLDGKMHQIKMLRE